MVIYSCAKRECYPLAVRKIARSPQSSAVLEVSIGYMVRNAHRAYDRILGQELASHDVLTGQWSLLRVLWNEDGLSQIEVAKRMKIERASLTGMLAAVEKAGFITRRPHREDGRIQVITLTKKGRDLERDLVPIGMAVNDRALAGFTKAEISAARALLQRMTDNLERGRR